MKNSDYLSVFCHILLPVAYEVSHFGALALCEQAQIIFLRIFLFDYLLQFCPDLVLVCAGFDSAIGDPEVLKTNHSNKTHSGLKTSQHLCPGCSIFGAIVVNVFNSELAVKHADLVHVDTFFSCFFQGEMCASPDIFAHLTHLLMNLAGGKLCAVLEVRPRSIPDELSVGDAG